MAPQSCSMGSSGKSFPDCRRKYDLYSATNSFHPLFQDPPRHAHDDGRIHLHEAAIGVVSESFVPGSAGETFDGAVVEAEIENGLHHSRHGAGGTGAHADEERIFRISELLFRDAFELSDVIGDLLLQLRRMLLVVLVKVIASFRGDGETGGHRQADLGHLGETRAFAAEKIAPGSVAFRFTSTEEIHPFFHCTPRLSHWSYETLAAATVLQRRPEKLSARRLFSSSSNT